MRTGEMNAILTIFLGAGLLWAQDTAPDPVRLLTDLAAANEAKEPGKIDRLLKDIADVGKTARDQSATDPLAKELSKSVKVCKGNWGTLRKIMTTLGELRSKKGLKALKRVAFRKKVEKPEEQELQAAGILGIALLRDPRQINGLADMTKSKSVVVAKAAYESFKHYGAAPGRVRKNIAGILMKRLEMEKPSSGGGNNVSVSAEQQARWQKLQPAMVESMQVICRQATINDVENWREWWKEKKKSSKYWKDPKKS